MFNSSRASANSIINRVMSNANGIGISKSKSRDKSDIRAENGHKVSDKAHSIKEVQNMRSITTQYINYIKDNFEGKVSNNINSDSAKLFLESKAQTVGSGTLNTYVSTMNKIVDNLNKDSIGDLSREDIKSIKNDLKENYSLSSNHENRAYFDALSIKNEMNNTPFSVSADLQHEVGLRASDSLDSSKWRINDDNTLTIEGSKGGITYQTKPLSDDLLQKVAEAKEMNYKANYTEYKDTLKQAVESTGQEWNGTHGLRYNFAQERVLELREQGYTESEANGITSLNMGHSRLEITQHYTNH